MSKIIIIPLGIYLNTNAQTTIDAFAKLGISKLSMLWHWPKLDKIFDSYRRGTLSTVEFEQQIGKLFPKAVENTELFEEYWNKCCELNKNTRNLFQEIEELKGYKAYVFTGTNPLHAAHIEKQYGKPIPGIKFFSYEKKKLERDLRQALIMEIYQNEPNITSQDISYFYQPAKLPVSYYSGLPNWLNRILAWCRAPFKMWYYTKAERYVQSLEQEAKRKEAGYTLIATTAETPIKAQLNKLGWQLPSNEPDNAPTLLSQHSPTSQKVAAPTSSGTSTHPTLKQRRHN